MSVEVRIVDGALKREGYNPISPEGAGAVVVFEGIVRPTEGDQKIEALDYEAYEPMASGKLEEIATSLNESHGLIGMVVEHSRGRVDVGACSFRLTVSSAHRREAIAAMSEFIDRLKQDVPIWKKPVRKGS